MTANDCDELRRTSPLALWRYAHDYLRAAQSLCRQHCLAETESQAPYHLAAQGLEFALKAYLCAKGATMSTLNARIGHSLLDALRESEAQGLPALAPPLRAAVTELSACHQDGQFVHYCSTRDAYVDVAPMIDAGVTILDGIAPDVAEHFLRHLADGDSPPTHDLVRRLRADLSATSALAPAPS